MYNYKHLLLGYASGPGRGVGLFDIFNFTAQAFFDLSPATIMAIAIIMLRQQNEQGILSKQDS
jgi:hypothetical protein